MTRPEIDALMHGVAEALRPLFARVEERLAELEAAAGLPPRPALGLRPDPDPEAALAAVRDALAPGR